MNHIVRKSILQELPLGEPVIYVGSSAFLQGKIGIKLKSTKKYMLIRINSNEYRCRYYSLTCQQIEDALKVHRKLMGIPEPSPADTDLPF